MKAIIQRVGRGKEAGKVFFTLSDNGVIILTSKTYESTEKAKDTLTALFPEVTVVDLTTQVKATYILTEE